MDPTLEDQIRAAHIVQGAAFGALEIPLSAALLASISVQTLAYFTAPGAKSFSWGIMMIASTSLGWGIAHTLRQEVFNVLIDQRRKERDVERHTLSSGTVEVAADTMAEIAE